MSSKWERKVGGLCDQSSEEASDDGKQSVALPPMSRRVFTRPSRVSTSSLPSCLIGRRLGALRVPDQWPFFAFHSARSLQETCICHEFFLFITSTPLHSIKQLTGSLVRWGCFVHSFVRRSFCCLSICAAAAACKR